jgi:hypothetical protein
MEARLVARSGGRLGGRSVGQAGRGKEIARATRGEGQGREGGREQERGKTGGGRGS